eukprot:CAMPEP_0195521516 /NCGR_PEP_ID=MMETSP0794_2-20130614/18842_1 /TAXON_ID=515487 /ORGANISM="Stephanopyxis turris, Strain CCMP 815" /LENGTH=344 /DNA_ID=CAMNT_0040651089 /DNA_START=81 /DNA_END=1112 /DNA_ORIENTATION=+
MKITHQFCIFFLLVWNHDVQATPKRRNSKNLRANDSDKDTPNASSGVARRNQFMNGGLFGNNNNYNYNYGGGQTDYSGGYAGLGMQHAQKGWEYASKYGSWWKKNDYNDMSNLNMPGGSTSGNNNQGGGQHSNSNWSSGNGNSWSSSFSVGGKDQESNGDGEDGVTADQGNEYNATHENNETDANQGGNSFGESPENNSYYDPAVWSQSIPDYSQTFQDWWSKWRPSLNGWTGTIPNNYNNGMYEGGNADQVQNVDSIASSVASTNKNENEQEGGSYESGEQQQQQQGNEGNNMNSNSNSNSGNGSSFSYSWSTNGEETSGSYTKNGETTEFFGNALDFANGGW